MKQTRADLIETGISWIGKIPAHWTAKPLWSLFERIKDVDHPEEQMLSVFRDHGVVAKDSRDNINKTAENRSIYQLVHPGWLVANRMKAWQGSVGISSLRGIVSGHYICFAPRHNEDNRYLNWLLRSTSYANGYSLLSRGVRIGQAEIDNDELRRMPILLPPREEQRAIADYLDRETNHIDTLIEEQQCLIEMLQLRRRAVVDASLSRGLGAGSDVAETGNPWLPKLPARWKAARAKHVLSFGPANGVSPPPGVSDDLRSLSLGAIRDGRVRMAPEVSKFVDRTSLSTVDAFRLKPRDILLVRGNGNVDLVARAGLVGAEFAANEYIYPDLLIRVRVNSSMLPEFFVWACNASATRAQVLAQARTAVGTFKVSGEVVRSLVLPLPPLDEQQSIVAHLNDQTSKIDRLIVETERFIELSKERRAALITAAVTGQIDAREAN